jgi:hypothetical protein
MYHWRIDLGHLYCVLCEFVFCFGSWAVGSGGRFGLRLN